MHNSGDVIQMNKKGGSRVHSLVFHGAPPTTYTLPCHRRNKFLPIKSFSKTKPLTHFCNSHQQLLCLIYHGNYTPTPPSEIDNSLQSETRPDETRNGTINVNDTRTADVISHDKHHAQEQPPLQFMLNSALLSSIKS